MKFDHIRHLKRVGQRKNIATTNTNKDKKPGLVGPVSQLFYCFVNLMDPGLYNQIFKA